jgi:hypothetical protein
VLSGDPNRNSIGKGRAVYVPEIVPAIQKPANASMSSRYWGPAVNHEALRDSVLWAIGGTPLVQTTDPVSPYIVFQMVHQEADNRLLLHVLNYNSARNSSPVDVPMEVTLPAGKKLKSIQLLTPDVDGKNQSLQWSGEQTARFVVPTLRIYSVVVLQIG